MNRFLSALLFAALFVLSALAGEGSFDVQGLLERIRSENAEVRYAARFEAPKVGAEAVVPLAALIDETALPRAEGEEIRKHRREVALSAKAALENIAHYAARPGAEAERRAVASKLLEALAAAPSARAKIDLLHLASYVASDAEVPGVARFLEDPDRNVRETARIALERIPGTAATRALISAAEKSPAETDLLVAIGRKGHPEGIRALLEAARSGPGPRKLAALKGLAHAGAAEAVPLFLEAARSGEPSEKATLFSELLRLADNLEARELRREAKEIFALAFRSAPLDHQRERALFRLSEGGGATDLLIAGLADEAERVRKLAEARLAQTPADALPLVRKAYEEAPRAARPGILRFLAERDPEGSKPLLEEASASAEPELKIAALEILGKLADPEMEPTYLEIARSGSLPARRAALKGYLMLARAKLAEGRAEEASAMFARALELAGSEEEEIAAIQGLAAAGNPKAVPILSKLLEKSAVAVEAARGLLALAPKLEDKDEAEKQLLGIVTAELPRELRAEAVGALQKLGRDPQAGLRREGFVLDWWVVTPIADPDGKGLERPYFPEERIRLDEVEIVEGKRYRWQKLTEVTLDGRFNLLTSFRKSENVVTYAYTEIDFPAEREVLFKLGSDDGIACWLNGQRIHFNDAARSLALDQDVVRAKLQAGKNRVLLKIRNQTGDWGFSFRIADLEGRPLDLSR